MKRKVLKYIIVAMLVVVSPLVQAKTPALDQQIQVVQNRYQQMTSLSAEFTQRTTLVLLNKTVTNTGTLQLQKPGKLRIDYTDVTAKDYISNGKTLWVVDPQTKQTERYKVGSSQVPKEALTFLNGFGHITDTYTVAERKPFAFTLTPKTPTSYSTLDAEFNADGVLTHLIIHNNSGNTSDYQFSHIQIDIPIPESHFHFFKQF